MSTFETLCGTWKRVLKSQAFSTFAVGSDVNSIVLIERLLPPPDEAQPAAAAPAAGRPQRQPAAPARYQWSFGSSLDSLRKGFVCSVDLASAVPLAGSVVVPLRVEVNGLECSGTYQPAAGLFVATLMGDSTATSEPV